MIEMNPSFVIVADPLARTKGGIENHADILMNLLRIHGYEVSFHNYKKFKNKDLKKSDVLIVEGIHRFNLLKILFLRSKGAKILFTHGSFYLWADERRYLWKIGGERYLLFKRTFDKIIMRKILMHFDLIVTLSSKETKDISDFFRIRSNNFVELEVFSDEPLLNSDQCNTTESFRYNFLCFIGRLDKRKNLIELLMAAHKLNMNLVVAGQDHGTLDELNDYCIKNNFTKFQYLGVIDNATKFSLIRSSSLVVIPSFFEGMPLLAVEALKMGKSTVLTKNSYMAPHPCIELTDYDSDSLVRAIRHKLDSNSCNLGFISNEECFEKFLSSLPSNVNRLGIH